MQGSEMMTRKDMLRRVVLLCCNFGRNLAYYRAGQSADGVQLLAETARNASFWRQANSSFLDIAVLEWYKLFGDKKWGKYHWTKIVSDAMSFEAGLRSAAATDPDDFDKWITAMRRYRHKFVAHLDLDRKMYIPMLDTAYAAVSFYHAYVVNCEGQPGDLEGLTDTPAKFKSGYEQCVREAKRVFATAAK
jgi:hypothetical protein